MDELEEGTTNATPKKKRQRWKATQRDILTREERRDFMRAINTWEDLIMCRVGFSAGLRIGAISHLCPKDVIIEDGISPVLHVREGKGGKSRYACCDEATAQMLRIYAMEKEIPHDKPYLPYSTRTLQRRFDRILERSGITRVHATPHTMRHTNATILLQKGMPLEEVKEHLGHEKIDTTMIYTHLDYFSRAIKFDAIWGE